RWPRIDMERLRTPLIAASLRVRRQPMAIEVPGRMRGFILQALLLGLAAAMPAAVGVRFCGVVGARLALAGDAEIDDLAHRAPISCGRRRARRRRRTCLPRRRSLPGCPPPCAAWPSWWRGALSRPRP